MYTYLYLANYEFTVALNTHVIYTEQWKHGLVEGQGTENRTLIQVILDNLFKTFSARASVYSSMWDMVWWCQQEPFKRLSKSKSQSCALVVVLFNLWSLVFFSVSGVAAPPSWSAMPDTLKSSANDREKGLATASFPWMQEESVGFLFIVLSKLCRGPQRHNVEHQQQGAWPTWNTPAIKESHVFSRVKQQLASKTHELSW